MLSYKTHFRLFPFAEPNNYWRVIFTTGSFILQFLKSIGIGSFVLAAGLLSGCLETMQADLQQLTKPQQTALTSTGSNQSVKVSDDRGENSKPSDTFAQQIKVSGTDAKATIPRSMVGILYAQDIIKIVGNINVRNFNQAKTTALLVGKTVDVTLNFPSWAAGGTAEWIDLKGLRGVSFTCKDFPNGFQKTKSIYKISTKISKFSVTDDVEGNRIGEIVLESCKG